MLLQRFVIASASLLTLAGAASAQVFYNNLGPADGWNATSGWTIGGTNNTFGQVASQAFRFTSSITGQLGKITAGLAHVPQEGGNSYSLEIHADAGGTVGATLGSWTVNNVPLFGDQSLPATSVTFTGGPTLTAATNYWFAVAPGQPTTLGSWGLNTTGAVGLLSVSTLPGEWHEFPNQTEGSFKLEAVPEPASIAALMAGLSVLLRRRPK